MSESTDFIVSIPLDLDAAQSAVRDINEWCTKLHDSRLNRALEAEGDPESTNADATFDDLTRAQAMLTVCSVLADALDVEVD